ncbi:hypothetical protein, partial [Bacteroides caccae]|uniref:hypothetical protein n=1 Tax=Bacteroides caccae TaxID=47678 RepID=UPI0019616E2B
KYMNIREEQKKAALEAGKQGIKDAYEKSKAKTGLKWWERLLWVVLAGGGLCGVRAAGRLRALRGRDAGPHGGQGGTHSGRHGSTAIPQGI